MWTWWLVVVIHHAHLFQSHPRLIRSLYNVCQKDKMINESTQKHIIVPFLLILTVQHTTLKQCPFWPLAQGLADSSCQWQFPRKNSNVGFASSFLQKSSLHHPLTLNFGCRVGKPISETNRNAQTFLSNKRCFFAKTESNSPVFFALKRLPTFAALIKVFSWHGWSRLANSQGGPGSPC